MKLYTIPDLTWEQRLNCWVAQAVYGEVFLRPLMSPNRWWVDAPGASVRTDYDSLEAAKAAANEHNRGMMERGLEAVETTEGE